MYTITDTRIYIDGRYVGTIAAVDRQGQPLPQLRGTLSVATLYGTVFGKVNGRERHFLLCCCTDPCLAYVELAGRFYMSESTAGRYVLRFKGAMFLFGMHCAKKMPEEGSIDFDDFWISKLENNPLYMTKVTSSIVIVLPIYISRIIEMSQIRQYTTLKESLKAV